MAKYGVSAGCGHKHRAIKDQDKEVGFQGCVARSGHCKPASHGNIQRVDLCNCSATRKLNINWGYKEFGDWKVMP